VRGRAAIVTGAAQGLGEAIARALYARGATVCLADVNVDRARRVASSLGARAWAEPVDVRDRESVRRAVNAVVERCGGLDVCVNNAARTVSRSFWEIEESEWDDVLAVNLRGVLFGCQLAGRHMRERGWGRIVNLTSLAGQQGGAVAGAHYAASKAGIIVLTKIVAKELAPHGVTVNAIAPAAVSGPVMETLPPDRLEAVRQTIPVGRFGEPEEVGALVAYLCAEEAGYITGATIDINGGLFMR
jgi:3-oxoacyl-[acyl-carrier protein] reductase